MKTRAAIFSVFILLALFPCHAFAHGLNIFAWLENDTIIVQCDFGQNRPAANASITVYDNVDKKELAHGITDASGRFSFGVPEIIRQGHGLLIVANAGQGHRGEWSMDASELYAAASLTAGFDQAAIDAHAQNPDHVHVQMTPATAPLLQGPVTPDQVRSIVQDALELKLAPIRQEIAARASSGPTLAEIIGGIGWILGLAGIAFYFKARKS